jgi:hypothetical protein
MITGILSSIICDEFDRNVGRGQDMIHDGKSSEHVAMDLELGLYNYHDNGEDGYRHLHIRIYGPCGYVAVLVKEDWSLIHESYLNDSGDGSLKKGKAYHEGDTGWMLAGYHDSCWREDVRTILNTYQDRLSIIKTLANWYKKTTLIEAERKEIYDIIRERDSNDFTRHWNPKKVVGPYQFNLK